MPAEFSTKLYVVAGLEKVRRVDRVAGPETADRGGEGLRLLERERVRAGLVDGLPGRDARVELKIGGVVERLKDPVPPTAPASSSVSEAIEIEPLLVVAPDTSRAAKFVPSSPVRSTVPLLTKDFAVTESDAESVGADIQRAGVGQRAADRQARAAVAPQYVEIDDAAVGRARRSSTPRRRFRDRAAPGDDRSEPGQRAVRPQRRAVLDEGVVSVEDQSCVSRPGW